MEIVPFDCLSQCHQNLILERWGISTSNHQARYALNQRKVLLVSSFLAASAVERFAIDHANELGDWVADDGNMGVVTVHADYQDKEKPWQAPRAKVFRLKPWEMDQILGE